MLWLNYIFAVVFLFLAFPVGNYLARKTKEELKSGKKYIALVFYLSILLSIISLFFRKDYLTFSFLFILIISYQSLRKINKK